MASDRSNGSEDWRRRAIGMWNRVCRDGLGGGGWFMVVGNLHVLCGWTELSVMDPLLKQEAFKYGTITSKNVPYSLYYTTSAPTLSSIIIKSNMTKHPNNEDYDLPIPTTIFFTRQTTNQTEEFFDARANTMTFSSTSLQEQDSSSSNEVYKGKQLGDALVNLFQVGSSSIGSGSGYEGRRVKGGSVDSEQDQFMSPVSTVASGAVYSRRSRGAGDGRKQQEQVLSHSNSVHHHHRRNKRSLDFHRQRRETKAALVEKLPWHLKAASILLGVCGGMFVILIIVGLVTMFLMSGTTFKPEFGV